MTRRIRALSGWAALLGSIGACGSEPRIPTSVSLNATTVAFTSLGQTQQLTPSVTDQDGKALAEAAVGWSSSNTAVATVSQSGLVTAVGAGSADVTATAGSATAIAQVTVVQTPTQLQKVSGDAQTGTVGQLLPTSLAVELRDALGNTIPGALVSFSVTQGGGQVASPSVTSGSDGRASTTYTLGTSAGPNQVSATSQLASVSAVFLETAVAAAPAVVGAQAGNGQSAPPGATVPTAPAVRVSDAFNNPVGGVSVTFEVGVGGGNVTGATQTTDATGIARVGSWRLGSAGTNTLIATAAGAGITGNPVTFTATATTSVAFDIQVRFSGSATPAQLQAFADAESRWEDLITGDLPNVPLTIEAGQCGEGSPAIDETIDDLVILASVVAIDGPLGILAQAGPCFMRTAGNLTVLGLMRFDEADLEDIEADGLLSDVILHEMAHVLGFGTLWVDLGLLADPVSEGGTDPHFTGPEALAAFNAVGGTAYTATAKVPVEDLGGTGTEDAHWRESVFRNELMTGFINLDQNPLSRVTVASLDDLGYSVNLSGADSYTLTSSLRALGSSRRLHLGNDIFRGPIRKVDARGRVTGVLRR
jgi:hypothetical protein